MAVTSVISDELTTLANTGRFATVLCRLSRARMSGVVYVEREDGGAVVSLRDGVPVFIEDLGGGDPLGDSMLAEEAITPEQYTAVMEQVLADLSASEDIAFAEKAVELGVLTQETVDAALHRRVRGQLIQALSWDNARIEIDDDPDGLTGPEYPHAIGPLLYMAVRTFFDDARVTQLLGEHRDLYLRLLRSRAEVAEDLGLDDTERELLEAFDPPSSVRTAIDRVGADSLEAHQLVAMLVLAEHVEHATRPWSAPIEAPSQQRSRAGVPRGRYVATEDIAEERLGPAASPRTRPVTSPVVPAQQPRRPPSAPVEDDYAFAAPLEQEPKARPPSQPQSQPQPRAPTSPVRTKAAPQQPAAAPAAPSAPRRQPEARPRRLGAALKRLGKELEGRRAQTQQLSEPESGSQPASPPNSASVAQPLPNRPGAPAAAIPAPAAAIPAPAAAPTAAAASGSAEQNAVRELIRRRRAMVSQQSRATGDKKAPAVSPAELMRSAQDAMREQQFGRAQELLTKACEADPSNDIFKMYRLWAAFRANTLQEDDHVAFRTIVRDKLNDDLHKAFAYYAMGHIMLAEKKDDGAEKFFRKAKELDKTNKDAERHVRLLELRKKSAATDGAANKIFGIEIGTKKS
jgi:hypothetical protein